MREKKRACFLGTLLLAALLLGGCDEGKPLNSAERSIQETENTGSDIQEPDVPETEQPTAASAEHADPVDADQSIPDCSLEIRYAGGNYQIDRWELYENLSEASIPAENLTDFGISLYEADNHYKVLLVTMTRTSTPDLFGDVAEQGYVNSFVTVTQERLDGVVLPESEEDTVRRMQIEHGYDPIYMEHGQIGKKEYFRMDFPPEGESVTYTLGWFLNEEEYEAAKAGALSLWYTMDEAQSVEELQLLPLPLELCGNRDAATRV